MQVEQMVIRSRFRLKFNKDVKIAVCSGISSRK